MYESFYNLTEKPFTLLPDPGFLYLSKKHQLALTLLEYGLKDHAGFTVISGEIGAGKTTLIRHLLNNMEHEYTVGLISNTHRSFGELLQWILLAFNLEHKDMGKVEMYQRFVDFIISEYAQNRRTVLIVDEAQNMDAETLEELRMLSNINADKDQSLQVILVGQRELRETLKRPELLQFAQRITVDYHLEPLSAQETAGYIRHRIQVAGGDPAIFTDGACEAAHRYSNGVPRLINLLCDTAMVYGYAEQAKHIDAKLMTDVAREKQQGGIFPIYAVAGRETVDNSEASEESGDATDKGATGDAALLDIADEPQAQPGPVSLDLASTTERVAEQPPELKTSLAAQEPAAVDSQHSTPAIPDAQQAAQAVDEDSQYRWLHEPSKKKLRLGICSAGEDLRRYLSRLLESYGFNVIAAVPIEAAQLVALVHARIDVLLVDRDTSHPLPQDAAGIIASWNRPVLYNDSTVTANCLRDGNPDFGLQLSERLHALVNASDADIAAVK